METLLPIATILSTGAGLYGTVAGAKQARGARRLAGQPVDVGPYYQPMTEAERVARERSIKADLAVRGIPPDSAYSTALIAEQMAGSESARYYRALDAAMRQRGQQLDVYTGSPSPSTAGLMSPFEYYRLMRTRGGRPGLGAEIRGLGVYPPYNVPSTSEWYPNIPSSVPEEFLSYPSAAYGIVP